MTNADAASQEFTRVVASFRECLGNQAPSEAQVGNLVWALASDPDLEFALAEAVRAERAALREEREQIAAEDEDEEQEDLAIRAERARREAQEDDDTR